MGHHISAVLLRSAYDRDKAITFDLKPLWLGQDIDLFPLDAAYCDHWSAKLEITGFQSDRPLLNCSVVHHMIRQIALTPLFAVIETDYFGGRGDQAAVVYRDHEVVMEPQVARIGPINEALRHLGVQRQFPKDEFDTVGLSRYRDFDDLFESYHDME